ncbi:MAG: hypothetical protein A2015_09990 [Spirochaetes bacterium GWF1_31_7]|nr:MAG: hypothetical protein A2Y30_10745 [Spirochaetes bacterium GWE1_32_154]OHD48286.1 MAG: hypothetical protein A2015_09990 [Spirochaetes bacterium GWF1_31_7]OHD51848.1 MAG: hypothetical protein A2Y29_17355 [Spirochaetes bacterium GWE2_31_10]OHD81791.1 MAG: hypothetical protein A2355_17315 [Spirochaetes bacterium RIFOXYB1_FULL_32_8]HBD94882.1 hypothetical protein [Spirochaetia bacterium]
MNILQTNINNNVIFKDLYEKSKISPYPLELTKSNHSTYKIDTLYIHSKYDPEKEALRTVEYLTNDADEIDIYILFGGGLGFVLSHLYNSICNSSRKIKPYIIYIEKDIKSFITALSVTDFSSIFKSDWVKIFIDAEKELIGSVIQTIPTQKVRYYYHRPLFTLNELYYKNLQNYISYILDRKDMNTATMARFQKTWTKNTVYNLPYLFSNKKLISLKDKAKNMNAVIVAGGPTLEKMIPYIKKNQNFLVIIAVDTSYKYLKNNDIIPDIVVSVDPQFWNFKYLENETLDGSILVTDPTSYYQLFRSVSPDKIYTGNSLFPLTAYFMDNTNRGVLSAGGSVSTTAFDVARIIGCSTIFLAGLDLGFPGKNTHFKGAFFETNFICSSDYSNTTEHKSFNYISHAGLLKTKATNGTLITDPKMVLFKNWFEREIPLTDAKVYLPDLGGSYIQGSTIFNLLDFEKILHKNEKSNFTRSISSPESEKNQSTNIINTISQFLSICKELNLNAKKIINIIPETGILSDEKMKKYEIIHTTLFSNSGTKKVADIITSSAQDILLSIMENIRYSDNETISLWIKTRKLYEAIFEMSQFYETIFNKLIKLINILPNINSDSL